MFTIAVILFGIKLINWHYTFPTVINEALGLLANPIELKPSFGPVTLELAIGHDAVVTAAAGSRAITPVPTGTIVSSAAHPDVDPSTPTTSAPPDIDWTEPDVSAVPSDVSGLSPVTNTMAMDKAASEVETPLTKALKTNKA